MASETGLAERRNRLLAEVEALRCKILHREALATTCHAFLPHEEDEANYDRLMDLAAGCRYLVEVAYRDLAAKLARLACLGLEEVADSVPRRLLAEVIAVKEGARAKALEQVAGRPKPIRAGDVHA